VVAYGPGLSRRDIILPGDGIAFRLDQVRRSDIVELEIERIGTLCAPLV
jgi:hypothetical protein